MNTLRCVAACAVSFVIGALIEGWSIDRELLPRVRAIDERLTKFERTDQERQKAAEPKPSTSTPRTPMSDADWNRYVEARCSV